MYVVAIHGERTEDRAEPLAEITGRALAEARARLRVPGTGPLVVAVLRDRAQAVDVGRRLKAAGFRVIAVGPEHVETDAARIVARTATLTGETLTVVPRQGEAVPVPLWTVTLLLFGTSASVQTDVREEKSSKLSLGRAALTGGLVSRKAVVRKVTTEEQIRERFVYLRAPGLPTVALREGSLQGAGEGEHATRVGRFAQLMADLRRQCSAARFDDRLLNRGTQAMLLGPALAPEDHLDLVTTLLIRSLT